MREVIALVTLVAGRAYCSPGSLVSIEDDEEAERLVERGHARWPTPAEPEAAVSEPEAAVSEPPAPPADLQPEPEPEPEHVQKPKRRGRKAEEDAG
ncbi:MAG: hypothetical protein AB7I13_00295 [Vicinamibacterales bacterium]